MQRSGSDREARLAAGTFRKQREFVRKSLHWKAINVGADVLVDVVSGVPVAPQAQHPDAHWMKPPNDRGVEAGGGCAKFETAGRDPVLLLKAQVVREMDRPRCDGTRWMAHAPRLRPRVVSAQNFRRTGVESG